MAAFLSVVAPHIDVKIPTGKAFGDGHALRSCPIHTKMTVQTGNVLRFFATNSEVLVHEIKKIVDDFAIFVLRNGQGDSNTVRGGTELSAENTKLQNQKAGAQTRPNILLITTDQQRGDCIGVEGRGVKTPNIDALCDRGTRFSTCITPHPMCQPARAAILTGKLPYSNGVRDNGRNLAPEYAANGIGGIFADAGYHTEFIGKAHLSTHETFHATGSPECYNSTADYPADWDGPYMGFDKVGLTLRPHHHCNWIGPPYTLQYENFLNQDGQGEARWLKAKEAVEPKSSHFQAWSSALDHQWMSTPWIGDQTVEMIEKSGESDQPFCAWVSFPDPHPPFLATSSWTTHHDKDEIEIAKNYKLDPERRVWWHQAFLDQKKKKPLQRKHAAGLPDWGEFGILTEENLRDITSIYFGMISAIDHEVGRIVAALEASGQLENTIIVFTSDHGDWMGDHGLLLKGPMLYDGLLRVPMIMAGPGVPEGHVVSDPVSTLDLRSTFADMADIAAEDDDGNSLVGVLNGDESREYALNEWEVDAKRSGIDLDLRTIRTKRYRMSVDLITGAGELYDMNEDPEEMQDLWGDPAHKAAQAMLMELIQARPEPAIPAAPRVGWH